MPLEGACSVSPPNEFGILLGISAVSNPGLDCKLAPSETAGVGGMEVSFSVGVDVDMEMGLEYDVGAAVGSSGRRLPSARPRLDCKLVLSQSGGV